MSLSRKEIDNIAHLARLSLSDAELSAYAESLTRIVALVATLDGAAVRDVTPMSHPLPGQTQRLRVDEVTESDQHEFYQRNAPQVLAGLYLVPKVIE